ncbi:MAG: hypothetical protein O3B31_05655 [Chloroflexi bacterium]|nr:hypothetical protein [Chloroflexota bacterium]MDA1002820.1 hypothetical protein [Chloroflexota bacterium]MQC27640.1 hypothetical protein [Chloroflexota bacterium]
MNRRQHFASAVLAAVLIGVVLQPTLGRTSAIVIAVAVAVAIDAGGRRLRGRGERPPSARDGDADGDHGRDHPGT